MQDYIYSIFSSVAIVIHLIINFDLRTGRAVATARGAREYRGFLKGVFAYYLTDAAWGILAGLGWTSALYVDTVLYFLALVVFVFMWWRFAAAYLGITGWMERILTCFGYLLLVFNIVMLTSNIFNSCFFYFDERGTYLIGDKRYQAFSFLILFNVLLALAVLVKALGGKGSSHGRNMMVFVNSLTMAVAIVLQVVWPLTPFTAFGCLIGNCFIHVFVIRDEQTEKHMSALEKALARARAAEKTRSMFFSIVSHDIRTPLNAILGYSELLQFGIKNKSERDDALKSIRASGTTLLQLVNDVLDLAKLDAGKMTFKPEPVRLSQLTDEVFATFKMTANAKGVALVNNTAAVPVLMLDGHRFRQILFNLIGNATKFTEHGSVTVAATYAGTTLEVSVADTGCGIEPAMLPRILDPFVQIQDASHSSYRAIGTGLGLSICRSLAEAMGGELIAESKPWEGSKFTVRIPEIAVMTEDAAAVAAPKPTVVLKQLPKNVLVVDDSPVNRSVLTAFLKKAGVTSINHAGDGEEALTKLESAIESGAPIDLVFSDYWMPNMNGLEFVEKLRDDSRFRHLPVFALTADTEPQHDSRSNLFTGVLFKPLTYAKLIDVLASMDGAFVGLS